MAMSLTARRGGGRSTFCGLYWMAFVLLALGFLGFAASCSSAAWVRFRVGEHYRLQGLWEACDDPYGCVALVGEQNSSWLIASRVMECLALVVFIASIVIVPLGNWVDLIYKKKLDVIFAFMAGGLSLVGVLLYLAMARHTLELHHRIEFGWALFVLLASSFLAIIASFLLGLTRASKGSKDAEVPLSAIPTPQDPPRRRGKGRRKGKAVPVDPHATDDNFSRYESVDADAALEIVVPDTLRLAPSPSKDYAMGVSNEEHSV